MTRQKDRTPAQKRLYSNLYYRYVALKRPKEALMQQEACLRGVQQRRRDLESYIEDRVSASTDAPPETPLEKELHSVMPSPLPRPGSTLEPPVPVLEESGRSGGVSAGEQMAAGVVRHLESVHESMYSAEPAIGSEVSRSSGGEGRKGLSEAGPRRKRSRQKPAVRGRRSPEGAGGGVGSGGAVVGRKMDGRRKGRQPRASKRGSGQGGAHAGADSVPGASESEGRSAGCGKSRKGRKVKSRSRQDQPVGMAADCEMVDDDGMGKDSK